MPLSSPLEQVRERQAAGEQAWWYVIGNRFNHHTSLQDSDALEATRQRLAEMIRDARP